MADKKVQRKAAGSKKPAKMADKKVLPVKQFKAEAGKTMVRNTTLSNIILFKGSSKTILTPNLAQIVVPANSSVSVDKELFAKMSKRKIIAGMLDRGILVVDCKKDVEITETVSEPTPPIELQPENVKGTEGDKTATVKTFKPESMTVPVAQG
jgi:hypothetical protein